jgi:ABC-type multidrug transport system permease subunit
MTLISGVYVPISALPTAMQPLSWASPLTYIVGGVRHGVTGYDEMPLWLCLAVVLGLNLILAAAALHLVGRRWRLVD